MREAVQQRLVEIDREIGALGGKALAVFIVYSTPEGSVDMTTGFAEQFSDEEKAVIAPLRAIEEVIKRLAEEAGPT